MTERICGGCDFHRQSDDERGSCHSRCTAPGQTIGAACFLEMEPCELADFSEGDASRERLFNALERATEAQSDDTGAMTPSSDDFEMRRLHEARTRALDAAEYGSPDETEKAYCREHRLKKQIEQMEQEAKSDDTE